MSTTPYVRPAPRPCLFCGAAIIQEFGILDADAYALGVVQRHICKAELPPPTQVNEAQFAKHLADCEACSKLYRRPDPEPQAMKLLRAKRRGGVG